MVISFIGGGNQSTRRKHSTCHNSHKNFSQVVPLGTPRHWVESELTNLRGNKTPIYYKLGRHNQNSHTIMVTKEQFTTTKEDRVLNIPVWSITQRLLILNNQTNSSLQSIHIIFQNKYLSHVILSFSYKVFSTYNIYIIFPDK